MKALAFAITLLTGSGLAMAASAQAPAAPAAPTPQPPDVIDIPGNMGKAHLTVTSNEIKPETLIPFDTSSYGKSISPQVSWTKGPAGTKSYAVLLEDSNGHNAAGPITHWLAYNIPATVTSLPAGLAPGAPATPAGMTFGKSARGAAAYMGPRTPAKITHHYHLQILALDEVLPLQEGATRTDFVAAIAGHVLATGGVAGIFTGPDTPPPAAQ